MEKAVFNELLKQLKNNNLAAYFGSGFSIGCGLPDWSGLIKPLADEIEIDLKNKKFSDLSLMQIAQYHENSLTRSKINSTLLNEYCDKGKSDKNHELLPYVGFSELWTTNYDPFIETAFTKHGLPISVKIKEEDLDNESSAISLYKIHGDYQTPDNCIVTQKDYEDFTETHDYFIKKLTLSLIQKTFIFIGFSFNDPDIKYTLAEIRRSEIKSSKHNHYIILKREKSRSKPLQTKFSLFLEDLKINYGLVPILIDDFSEITILLEELIRYQKRDTVFISGATISETKIIDTIRENFITSLAKSLIQNGFKITSGYGLGVGQFVITGALREIYSTSNNLDNKLKLHPFPQNVDDEVEKKELWTKYRSDMCKISGIQIIIYGYKYINKEKPSEGIKNSDGIEQEFQLARKAGLFIIPVGSTGYQALEIWKIINKNLTEFGYTTKSLKDNFKKLSKYNDEDERLIQTIINIINEIKEK